MLNGVKNEAYPEMGKALESAESIGVPKGRLEDEVGFDIGQEARLPGDPKLFFKGLLTVPMTVNGERLGSAAHHSWSGECSISVASSKIS